MTGATPGQAAEPAMRPAWRSPGAWVLVLVITAVGLAADLWTKHLAFERVAGVPVRVTRAEVMAAGRLSDLIPAHEPVVAIPSVLRFTLVLNPGAVFGIGAGQRVVFIVFTLAAVLFALWMFATWTRPRDRWAHVGIGLLIAGGLGNLYDRLRFACVRDFIHPLPGVELPFGITWPNGSREVWPYVSNVADLWLIIAITILLVVSWMRPSGTGEGRAHDAA